MRNEFNLVVDKENKKLPKIYWTPKLYKHPSKTRFIKLLPNVLLSLCLKIYLSVLKLAY